MQINEPMEYSVNLKTLKKLIITPVTLKIFENR